MQKTNKKGLWLAVIVVALAIAAFLVWKFALPTANEGAKTLNIDITHLDGSTVEKELHTDAETLWDAMYEAKLIDGTDSDYGKWVTTVDGEVADEANNQYWLFTKGGEWVDTGCDSTYIADGESYEFFIEVF